MIQRISSLLHIAPPAPTLEGILLASGATVPANGTRGYAPGGLFQDTATGKLYVNQGTYASCSFAEAGSGPAAASASAAVAEFVAKGDTLPASAVFVGQLFVKTGDSAGLYVSTGTTTPAWKAVSHAE